MTDLLYENMTVSNMWVGDQPLPPIVFAPNGPFASGTRPKLRGQIVDGNGNGIRLANLVTFTLTLMDTLTGSIVNEVDRVDVLNTGRGQISDGGGTIITLTSADTGMTDVPGAPKVQRSAILEWSTDEVPPDVGRQQMDFILLRLAQN